MYTLFENPLDNAITACSGIEGGPSSRCIRLRIFKEKVLIWVEIKNPKSNDIIVKNNSIQTTKEDTSAHGLGLKNMERVIKRYNGYLNIDYDSDEFIVTMAFPL
ncbi:ATP-binding protein [Enterocloster bolteae]|nr:ATP-binding protein [Enterocloster bolteae]